MARIFLLKGDIANPGYVDIPDEATTIREVIYGIGGGIPNGKKFKAVQIGGPSGGLLVEEHLDLPLHFQKLKPLRRAPRRQRHHGARRGPLHGRCRVSLYAVHADRVLRQVRSLPRGHKAHERAALGHAGLPPQRVGLSYAHRPWRDDLDHGVLQSGPQVPTTRWRRPSNTFPRNSRITCVGTARSASLTASRSSRVDFPITASASRSTRASAADAASARVPATPRPSRASSSRRS